MFSGMLKSLLPSLLPKLIPRLKDAEKAIFDLLQDADNSAETESAVLVKRVMDDNGKARLHLIVVNIENLPSSGFAVEPMSKGGKPWKYQREDLEALLNNSDNIEKLLDAANE